MRQLGYLADETLQRWAYAAADLFVFPTLADNQPLVLIEALACGTPIVAFDVGGVPEMVQHLQTGYLARYRDPADLLHGITTLLGDQALHADMRRACRQFAEKYYGQELQSRRYIDVYTRAIQDASAQPIA